MFTVALAPSNADPQSSSDDRSHRRARPRSPVESSNNSNTVRVNNVSNANFNGRRPHNHASSDTVRHHHESHEYNPEDFDDRNSSSHNRSRSDQGDLETHGSRSMQHSERSRDRGFRNDRSRSSRPEESEDSGPRRRRCRNFDDRGFCIYGDRCKYEHGSDALVIPNDAAWTAANLFDTALAATGNCLLPAAASNVSSGLLDAGVTLPTSVEQDDDESGGLPIYTPTPSTF